MAKQFGAIGKSRIITNIPKELEIIEFEGIKALKFGCYAKLDLEIIRATKEAGVISYWDNENLFISVSSEYAFIINSIWTMFKPLLVRFAFSRSFSGRILLILAI